MLRRVVSTLAGVLAEAVDGFLGHQVGLLPLAVVFDVNSSR